MDSRNLSRNEIGSFSDKYIRETKNKVHVPIKWTYWLKGFIIEFINQCKFGLYMIFIASIYNYIILDIFPEKFSETFLVIAIIQGCNLGIKGNSALISKMLIGISKLLLSSDNSK